jgi:type I restriction enzyme S subunit
MPQNKKTKTKNAADSSTANQKPNSLLTKPGFKLTKLGWLPLEWEVVRLKDCCTMLSGGTPSKQEPEYWGPGLPWFSAKDLKQFNLVKSIDEVTSNGALNGTRKVTAGTILILVRGMMLNRDLPVGIVRQESTFNQDLKALIVNETTDAEFLASYLITTKQRILSQVNRSSHGTGKIESLTLSTTKVPLPPLKEQTRIANCLSTWDRAITTTRNLLQQLDERKKGLMQGLLSGAVRVPGFEDEWEEFKIGKFVKESKLPGTNGLEAKKLTVKLWGRGVKRKIDKQPGSTNTNYFTRKSGQLIYSKLDFLNCAFGLIPDELDGLESTLDLPTFDISDKIDPIFLLERIKQKSFYKRFGERANGSRIARRINPDLFRSFPINLPSLPEQRAIAKILTTADQEIVLYKRKLAKLEAQKKGLMQQLLTGQKRLSA